MMRLLIFTCLSFFWQASGFAFNTTPATFAISVDSIHHINCQRATGYLEVVAMGGVAPITYAWSNGNTTNIDDDLPAGPYVIVATDGLGAISTLTINILEDLDLPTANAGADFSTTCSNSVVSLSGSGSVGPEFKYAWTAFNGGVIQSGATTLSPVIKNIGSFVLTVRDTINGCTTKDTVVVTAMHQAPVVTATGDTFTCAQPLVTLNATFPAQHIVYLWNGPNGFMSNNLNPQVNVAGVYVFKATDTLTTCFNTANALVTADTSKPVFPLTGGTITCAQPSVVIGGTASPMGVTFFWKGAGGFTSTLQNPTVFMAGTYTVSVTNPGNGCVSSNSITIASNLTPPTATATTSGSITCVNNAVQLIGGGSPSGITFFWSGPNSFNSYIQSPVVNVPGNYTLTVTNPVNGCTKTTTTTVVQNTTPPGASATGGVRNCNNSSVTLSATSPTQGVTYQWSGPSGFNSTQQNPVVSAIGTYTVTVTNPANGCKSTATASVTQNFTPPSLSATTAIITCYTPSPTIVASSQTPGATFAWTGPNNFTSNIANPSVSTVGFYFVTATNPANGCTSSTSVWVTDNLATPNVHAGDDRYLNCNFQTILANPIGTSTGSNLTYLWTTWDGNISEGANTLYARFDEPGNYTLKVTHTISGCFRRDSMVVYENPPLQGSVTQLSGISCNGSSNGSLRANASGGAEVYSYNWSSGHGSQVASGLSAGTYTVTIYDGQGCSITATATLNQPGPLVANVSATGQTQSGVNNGTATVNPSGGSAPYGVAWSNGGTSLTITNLAPGQYTVTVTDANGCTKSNNVTVNPVNCAINGSLTATDVNCAGSSTGSVNAAISGAIGPISYVWSNSAQTQNISNVAAGTYTVTATGSNGCTIVLSTQVSSPQPLAVSVTSNTSVTCFGGQNGAAGVNALGGTAPYTYLWSNGGNSASIVNLSAGTYTCTVTDSKGCTRTSSTQITGPQPINLNIDNIVNTPCVDGQTGEVTVSANGGTLPYVFVWSNNAAGPTAGSLGAGTYTCTVTDQNGCSGTKSAQIVVTDNTAPQLILQNATVALDASGAATVTAGQFDNGSFDATCEIVSWTITPTTFNCSQLGAHTVTLTATDKNGNVATGTAQVTVLDQTAPTLTCSANQTAAGCSATVFFNEPTVDDNCTPGGAATLVSGLVSGSTFPEGITQQQYSYTDAGGNTATCSFTITVSGGLNAQITSSPTSCTGICDGTATLALIGGGNVSSVVWNNGQTGFNAIDLCTGNYEATITDATGCSQVYSTTVTMSDNQAPFISCPTNISVGFCNATVTFGAPQVLDNCGVNPQLVQQIDGLPSGSVFPLGVTNQAFSYVDGGGNAAQCSFTVTVNPAAIINISSTRATCFGLCDGAATITAGNGGFGILWSNGAAGPTIANLCAGLYTATVVDNDGCQQVQSVVIAEPQPLLINSTLINHDTLVSGDGDIVITVSGGTLPYSYEWSLNGQYFANTKDLHDIFAGNYTVMITDGNGCTYSSDTLEVLNFNPVSTEEQATTLSWAVYPNPVQSTLFVRVENQEMQDAQLQVFDLSGKLLLEQTWDQGADITQLNLSGLPDGMLLLRLSSNQGIVSKMILKTAR